MSMNQNPRRNDDCYFYYYSTCMKGDSCTFRHEESALGCEVVCQFWKEGKCLNEHCNLRHMELKKNRKAIPCYWETQPGGCRKQHCSFRHNAERNPGQSSNVGGPVMENNAEVNLPVISAGGNVGGAPPCAAVVQGDQHAGANQPVAGNQLQLRNDMNPYGNVSVVDSVVVKFEEESDNESVPSVTPVKFGSKSVRESSDVQSWAERGESEVKVKTLEEIRLERVQKESASYYGMHDDMEGARERRRRTSVDDVMNRYPSTPFRRVQAMTHARYSTQMDHENAHKQLPRKRMYSECKVLSLEEIRRNRQLRFDSQNATADVKNEDSKDSIRPRKHVKKSNYLPDFTSETEMKDDYDLTYNEQRNTDHNKPGGNKWNYESTHVKQSPVKLHRYSRRHSFNNEVMCDDRLSRRDRAKKRCLRIITSDDNDKKQSQSNTDNDVALEFNDNMSSSTLLDDDRNEFDILRDIDDMLND